MSEIRVDNILSANGSAAPTYSQGVNVAAGKTFNNSGDFTTAGISSFSGATTFAQGAVISGVSTFTSGVSGLNVVGPATFTQGAVATGVVTFTGLSITAGTVAHTGGITVGGASTFSNAGEFTGNLTVGGNISCAGTITYEDVTSVDSVGVVTARTDLKVNRNATIVGLSTFTGAIDANGGIDVTTAKVGDLTDNRVVIAGASGELEDSGNLTFDGTTLTVTGTVAATNLTAGGKAPATTGKAIAMAMIFGG